MVNSIRLFYNTGFNFENVPDSPDLLNTCFHRDLEGHWEYQDFFLSSLKVKIDWNMVNNADYLKFGRGYYFITGITMINENNAEIHLELDALTTMGGANNLEYITGIITRAHTNDDSLFSNVIDEPIGCSEELEIVGQTETSSGNYASQGGYALVASTVDLSTDLSESAYTDYISVGGVGSAQVIIPEAPPTSPQTKVFYTSPNGTTYSDSDAGLINYSVPFGYYDLSKDLTKKNLRILRSFGLETAAVYAFVLPGDYASIGYASGEDGVSNRVSRLEGQRIVNSATSFKENYSNIKNNKTFAMYNYYVVRSNTSGDMKKYNATDLGLNSSDVTPSFIITADPQYGGCAYCTPQNYKGITINNPTYESVQSLAWYDLPICYTNMSGQYLYANDYNTKVMGLGVEAKNLEYNVLSSVVPGAASTYSDTGANLMSGGTGGSSALNYGTGLISTAFSTAAKANTLLYKAQKLDTEYAQNKVVAPELSCEPVRGLQRVLPNNFTIYHITPTAKDIAQIDKYFTYYGYAQPNIVFDKSYLSGRQYFNYVKCANTKIMRDSNSDPFGIGIKTKAEEQLNGGVRIWHVLPQQVSSNPIV